MTLRHCLSLLAVAGAIGAAQAENLLFNGSFELDDAGIVLNGKLRPDTNPELKMVPLKLAPDEHGRHLVLSNPHREEKTLIFREFRLDSKRRYRLTFRAKADQLLKLSASLLQVDTTTGWTSHNHYFSITPEWKEYSTVIPENRGGWYHLRLQVPAAQNATELQLDDLRLEEPGSATPDTALEAIADAESNLYEKELVPEAKITLKVFNRSGKQVSDLLTVTGCDEYTKKVLFRKEFPVTLNPQERREFPFCEPNDRFGAVRLVVSGKNVSTFPGFYAVIGRYVPGREKIDLRKDSVLAFCYNSVFKFPPYEQPGGYRLTGDYEAEYALLARAGARFLRDHKVAAWAYMEPEDGKFDFTEFDRALRTYEKYQMQMVPIWGRNDDMNPYLDWMIPRLPEWLYRLSKRVEKCTSLQRQGEQRSWLYPLDRWERFTRTTVERYKGRIPAYEIINEPCFSLHPDYYIPILKTAYQAIKKADPAALVVGYCLSTDFQSDHGPWIRACNELGGLNFCDVVSFHPYASIGLHSIQPADRAIEEMREEFAKFGRQDIPLWNTELFYLHSNVREPNGNDVKISEFQPHQGAARFLLDLGEGVKQSVYAVNYQLWKNLHIPHMMNSASRACKLIPSENYVMFNALARLFERAKPVAKFKRDSGVILYVYRDREGELIAAVWNYLDRRNIRMNFSGLEVMDLFGNPVESGELPVTGAQYYLRRGRLSEAEFLNHLKTTPVRSLQPVSVCEVGRRTGDRVFVTLYNEGDSEEHGLAAVRGGGMRSTGALPYRIPPRGPLRMEFPIEAAPAEQDPPALRLYANRRNFVLPFQLEKNRKFRSGEPFRYGNTCGKVEILKDSIQVRVEVRDATPAGARGKRDLWRTDCVELFFDLDPLHLPLRHTARYTPQVFRLFLTPRDRETLHVMHNIRPEECDVKMEILPGGYTFTVNIRRKVNGTYLGFECKTDDATSTAFIGESSLSGKHRPNEYRTRFELIGQ